MNLNGASRLFAPARRNSFFSYASWACALALIIPATLSTAGCGGGGGTGGGGSTKTDTSTTTGSSSVPYSPNYRAEVIALRHWDKSVVTVNFVAPAADSQGTVRNVQPLIAQAISLWNARVGNMVNLQLVSDATADVTVNFVDPGTLPDGAIGRTEVTFRNADQILINGTVKVDRSLSDDLETQVLTHELGHSLGIEGHSQNSTDLMYAQAHLPVQITSRDENTILLAYSGGSTTTATQAGAASSADMPGATRMVNSAKATGTSTATYDCAERGEFTTVK